MFRRINLFGYLLMAPQFDGARHTAVILGGGDGLLLSAFNRRAFAYHIPKQFRPLFDGGTTPGKAKDILQKQSQTALHTHGSLLIGSTDSLGWFRRSSARIRAAN
jgi:hypothetical protein